MRNSGFDCMSGVTLQLPNRGLLPSVSNPACHLGLKQALPSIERYHPAVKSRRAFNGAGLALTIPVPVPHSRSHHSEKRSRRRREAHASCVSDWVYRPVPMDGDLSDRQFSTVDEFLMKTQPMTSLPTFPFGEPFATSHLPSELDQLCARGDHELIHALIGREHDERHPVTHVLRHRGWWFNSWLRCWYRRTNAKPKVSSREYDLLDVQYFEANLRQQLTGLKLVINFRWVHKQFEMKKM